MNKKILFLLLVFMLTLTGCNTLPGPSEYADLGNTYYEESDYPFRFNSGHSLFYVTPAENGYFYFTGQQLRFFDKETLESTILCNRPECQHQDESCSSVFKRELETALQYYNGKVYVETFETTGFFQEAVYLYEVDPTTCTRKKVCQLPYSYDTTTRYMMHRGYLYMVNHAFMIEEKTERLTGTLRVERVALNELEEKSLSPELLFEAECAGLSMGPFLYGEHLLFGTTVINDDTVEITAYDLDLTENRISEVVFPYAEEGSQFVIEDAKDGKLILTYASPEVAAWESFENVYYEYDLTNSTYTPLVTLADRGERMSDFLKWDGTQWIAFRFDRLGVPESYNQNQEVRILDESFETVKSLPIDTYTTGVIAGDEEFMFIGDGHTTYQLYAIDKRGDELKLIEIYKEDSAN